MKTVWANQHPMDSSGLMVKQAEALRALNPHTRFFVYRNLVKALPWITCVREKLEDPAFSGWFLKYDPAKKSYAPNVPPCDLHRPNKTEKCSALYHDQRETPELRSECAVKTPPPSCDPTAGTTDPTQFCDEPCDCGKVPCGEYGTAPPRNGVQANGPAADPRAVCLRSL